MFPHLAHQRGLHKLFEKVPVLLFFQVFFFFLSFSCHFLFQNPLLFGGTFRGMDRRFFDTVFSFVGIFFGRASLRFLPGPFPELRFFLLVNGGAFFAAFFLGACLPAFFTYWESDFCPL